MLCNLFASRKSLGPSFVRIMHAETILESWFFLTLVGSLGGILLHPLLLRTGGKLRSMERLGFALFMAASGGIAPHILLQHASLSFDAEMTLSALLIASTLSGAFGFLVATLWRGNYLISRVLDPHMISCVGAVIVALSLVYLLQPGDTLEYHPFVVAPAIAGGLHRLVLLLLYVRVPLGDRLAVSQQIEDVLDGRMRAP